MGLQWDTRPIIVLKVEAQTFHDSCHYDLIALSIYAGRVELRQRRVYLCCLDRPPLLRFVKGQFAK